MNCQMTSHQMPSDAAITEGNRIGSTILLSSTYRLPVPNFDTFDALESIKILGDPFKRGALIRSLLKLYASLSHLNSITIEKSTYLYGTALAKAVNLWKLFSSLRDNPAQPLSHLSLSG